MVAKYKPVSSQDLRLVGNIEKLDVDTSGNPLLDETGSPLGTYSLWAENVRFAIDDWKPYEQYNANQVERQLSTRFRIRWRPGMEGSALGTFRFVVNQTPGQSPPVLEVYDIIGAVRDPTMRIDMNLTCTLRDAPGFRAGEGG
jgi:hypothetical protein